VRAGALKRLFARFDRALRERGYLAMGGQIVDATIIEARRPRLTEAEKETIKGGGVPAEWKPARRAQIDRDGRWTLKRGKKRQGPAAGAGHKRGATSELVIPAFGYKNHVGIDRTLGFVRRFTVTHAAAPDGRELGRLLDGDNLAGGVWADTAYRSEANLQLLDRRGLVPQFQRRKPRGKPMPAHIRRGNATRARVRARVEHVFAAEKRRLHLVIRTIGQARATAKITLANLAYNFTRLAWLTRQAAAAGSHQRYSRQAIGLTSTTCGAVRLRGHRHHPLSRPQAPVRTGYFEMSKRRPPTRRSSAVAKADQQWHQPSEYRRSWSPP
jgi:transposase, IS5 family